MIYIGLLAWAITWLEITYLPEMKALKNLNIIYSLVGFVISLLLVFRTNTAYDRWWEGRKKWGELVNDSRNISLKLSTLNLKEEDRQYFARMIANFAIASKDQLKKQVVPENLDLNTEEWTQLRMVDHIPVGIVQFMYNRLMKLKQSGVILKEDFLALEYNLNGFTNMIGACERIRNTPIPFSYSLFIKKFIFIYTCTLPIAFVSLLGYFSVIVTVLVFYVLVSMEILAEEIEDPFGLDDNDLPTEELAERIKSLSANLLK